MSESLLNEIRTTKPVAPSALRDRVRALAAQEPVREPFLSRFRRRQLMFVAPVALVVAVFAAGVIGLTRDDVVRGGDRISASAAGKAATTPPAFERATPQTEAFQNNALAPATADSSGAVAPAPGQKQRYEAELRLRLDDVEALSEATKRAQQITLSHGGSIASLQYDAPATGVGSAQITLRIPIGKVQSALTQLSALGTIVGQRYGIEDLQQQADSLQTQIEQTQRRIAQILTQLESASLSAENRVVLQSRLTASRQKLAGLREAMQSTNAEARTATVFLTLTTEKIEPAAVGGSRIDDVKNVLAWEAIGLLFALVVAGPFLAVGFLVWLALRLRRRQVEARLLAQN